MDETVKFSWSWSFLGDVRVRRLCEINRWKDASSCYKVSENRKQFVSHHRTTPSEKYQPADLFFYKQLRYSSLRKFATDDKLACHFHQDRWFFFHFLLPLFIFWLLVWENFEINELELKFRADSDCIPLLIFFYIIMLALMLTIDAGNGARDRFFRVRRREKTWKFSKGVNSLKYHFCVNLHAASGRFCLNEFI